MIRRVGWITAALLTMAYLSGCCFLTPGEKVAEVARRLSAGPVVRETRQVSLDGADQVRVTLAFGGGDLDIRAGSEDLLSGEFTYNLEELAPEIVYNVEGATGELLIQHQQDSIRWERIVSEVRNEWVLYLTESVPLDLNVDVGASTGELDLGGLRITNLNLTAGAADLIVRFDRPNPERLKTVRIHSGAARLALIQLGNAQLEDLVFDGGLGMYTFDFRGSWQHSATVQITTGAGQVILRLPKDIGVRVCPGDLRNADYGGLEEQDECYINDLYKRSDTQLDISLDIGLGNLVLRQE